jgi:hypothetical protein
MAALLRELRKDLERAVILARRAAVEGAEKAVMALAVHEARPYGAMSEAQKKLRNRLRAHGRQLGDALDGKKEIQEIEHVVAECAYEHWHRMLFARFLAENDLLIHPQYGAPISLEECRGLARSRGIGWVELAAEYAEGMLPQIFRRGDPMLEVVLPPESRHELEELLEGLPREVFIADDSLGWTYQFWQTEVKERVNRSGRKIGSDELAPVTQLFTEDYMVLFLLHNTLGAWWVAKCCPEGVVAESEEEARAVCALPGVEWTYLRFVQDEGTGRWWPAAGAFEGWPRAARDVTVLDPCMGSGHFLVFALPILAAFRLAEEELSREDAIGVVLRDNLFGLELDARCTQIAAFNLALAAWKAVGYRPLPALNLACSGSGIRARESEWVRLSGADTRLASAMREMYRLFKDAPILGSLIDPRRVNGDLFKAQFDEFQPLLEQAIGAESTDPDVLELAVTAQGLVHATRLLSNRFTLIATNVPYLARGKQDERLKAFCDTAHPRAKADLSTAFIERCCRWCLPAGTVSVVTPQNSLFLGAYKHFRKHLLSELTWRVTARLGPAAFQDMNFWAATTAMIVVGNEQPVPASRMALFDVSGPRDPAEKAGLIRNVSVESLIQSDQLQNPDCRIASVKAGGALLSTVAQGFQGVATGDYSHFGRCFWELPRRTEEWEFQQSTVIESAPYAGREHMLLWEDGRGALASNEGARIQGLEALGRLGIVVSQMNQLPVTLYTGELFDNNCSAVVVKDPDCLAAVWAFCSSPEYRRAIREIDQTVKVTNATLTKVVFDRSRWERVASETYPAGIPKPASADPTQWLFVGMPQDSEDPLQVAVARLLGYQWPRQTGSSFHECPAVPLDRLVGHADDDGIVCLTGFHQKGGAGDRLRSLLADAFGGAWSARRHDELLAQAGYVRKSLEDWLLDGFFEHHCQLFHQRPFVWQIWDGRRDGFAALVNYHRLAAPNGRGRRLLEKLAHTYLGDWITRQRADQRAGVAGADARLAAAQHLQGELEKISEGEPPYDIFVRWKPLHEQPIGWEPDLNDGVRINIRPFMMAKTLGARGKKSCILRVAPSINWQKDRGTEPERPREDFPWFWSWDGETQDFEGGREYDGARWNDLHYTRAFKQAARERHARTKSR